MQHPPMLVLVLALASHVSNGIAIGDSKELNKQLAVVSTSEVDQSDMDPILVRPKAGKSVDIVRFGLRAKNFYGSELKKFRFSIDMVMTIKWNDPRNLALIPAGVDKLSMSWEQAEKLMWMPGVVVSNRDIEMYEIISSAVTIYRSGEVRRVERANARIMKRFALADYPFDKQLLSVNIASSKYMVDEVVLVPDPDPQGSGCDEDIWGLYDLLGWSTKAIEQEDGDLVKSRGILSIEVRRNLDKYEQDHLMPSFIILAISWSVFYFPFANPFITARLALSILALLQFTKLIVKSTGELPGAAPFNWNDLFNQQIQTLMFLTIVLNISTEICYHTFHNEHLARSLNNESKILMPVLSLINIALILGGCKYHWMGLPDTIIATKVVLALCIISYFAYAFYDEWTRHLEEAHGVKVPDLKKLKPAPAECPKCAEAGQAAMACAV